MFGGKGKKRPASFVAVLRSELDLNSPAADFSQAPIRRNYWFREFSSRRSLPPKCQSKAVEIRPLAFAGKRPIADAPAAANTDLK